MPPGELPMVLRQGRSEIQHEQLFRTSVVGARCAQLHIRTGAASRETERASRRYYYSQLRELVDNIVEKGKHVLCVRSDIGQYLEWAEPSVGVGVDVSQKLV